MYPSLELKSRIAAAEAAIDAVADADATDEMVRALEGLRDHCELLAIIAANLEVNA